MAETLTESRVLFPGDGIMMRGVLIYPKKGGRYPAVMVHPGAGGLNDRVVELGRKIAHQGYASLVIDLYSYVPEDEMPAEQGYPAMVPYFKKLNEKSHLTSLDGGLRYLQTLPMVQGDRIGILGFCAAYPLVFACLNLRLKASVSFYNQFKYSEETQGDVRVSPIDRVANLCCPWQGHYGEEDPYIPPDQRALFKDLAAKYKKEVELHMYPGCGHVFAEPGSAGYKPQEAEVAWRRTFEFLAKHLKS